MTAPHGPTSTRTIRPLPDSAPVALAQQQIHGDGWRITVLTDGLLRIERWDPATPGAGPEDRSSAFAIRRELPVADFTARRHADGVTVTTRRVRLRYDGGPFTSSGLIAEMIGADTGRWRYGEPTRDLGGTARTLDDVDGRTGLEAGVAAPDGIAVIDDAASMLFEDDGWIGVRRPDQEDLYVFAHGRDYPDAVRALYAVSGDPMLLPRWALGTWWSRYHPYSDDSYLALLDRFEEERVPLSVAVIDMDWHRVDTVPPRFGNGWTGYSWEPSLFPDPAAFLTELHRRGMRTTLNLHPADGVRAFEDRYAAIARAVGIDPDTEAPVPFSPTDPAFLEAYFRELHHPLEQQGVDFWWIDWQQGRTSDLPGVDPLWVLNHFHHLDAARDGGSGMTFSRYAGPGSHRYAVGFSGDAVVSWASLDFQPEFTATASNIGYSWWSHDIGGHTRGIRDDELATRWVQYGVLSPITRLHSANNPFIRKEPWLFPAEHRAAMDDALRFRHRLVPYLHTMNHRNAEDGLPLVRPMYHAEPRRPEAYTVPNQYEFGTELVVVPITAPRDAASLRGTARAWLPDGLWTDVMTGTVYRGDRAIDLHRTIAGVPVLLRAGGILPLDGTPELDATRNPEHLEIVVAPTASGRFELIEDAEDSGEPTPASSSATDASSARTAFTWDPAGELRIEHDSPDPGVVPAGRRYTITFLALLPSGPVTVDGVAQGIRGQDGRWSVDADGPDAVVATGPLSVGADPTEDARVILEEAQAGNPEKLEAWSIISSGRPTADRLVELQAVGLPASVIAAVTEVVGSVVRSRS